MHTHIITGGILIIIQATTIGTIKIIIQITISFQTHRSLRSNPLPLYIQFHTRIFMFNAVIKKTLFKTQKVISEQRLNHTS